MTSKSSRSTRPRSRTQHQGIRRDAAIQDLLTQLAHLLVPAGITPRRLSELARYAFVQTAAANSKFRNGKINHSKVAVLTGLSRAEVKKLLGVKFPERNSTLSAQTRVDRVIYGWTTDNRFLDESGKPARLTLSGSAQSFPHLVRQYGGDVPHRAVLDQMRRLGLASQLGDSLTLNRRRAKALREKASPVTEVLPILADGLRATTFSDRRTERSAIYRLIIPVRDTVELAIAKDRANAAAKSLVTGLDESLRPQRSRGAAPANSPSLIVTILITDIPANHKTMAESDGSIRSTK